MSNRSAICVTPSSETSVFHLLQLSLSHCLLATVTDVTALAVTFIYSWNNTYHVQAICPSSSSWISGQSSNCDTSLYPLQIRGKAISIAEVVNFVPNFLVSLLFPIELPWFRTSHHLCRLCFIMWSGHGFGLLITFIIFADYASSCDLTIRIIGDNDHDHHHHRNDHNNHKIMWYQLE
jgi:hypothetical protein